MLTEARDTAGWVQDIDESPTCALTRAPSEC